jgi:hypothetical protein
MIEAFAKTWFIWWMIATLAILLWFHLVSSSRLELEPEDAGAEHEDIQDGISDELNPIRL